LSLMSAIIQKTILPLHLTPDPGISAIAKTQAITIPQGRSKGQGNRHPLLTEFVEFRFNDHSAEKPGSIEN